MESAALELSKSAGLGTAPLCDQRRLLKKVDLVVQNDVLSLVAKKRLGLDISSTM